MSSRKWMFRVRHILEAIERIRQYTAGMDEAGFAGDQKTIDARCSQLQVIGEAALVNDTCCEVRKTEDKSNEDLTR